MSDPVKPYSVEEAMVQQQYMPNEMQKARLVATAEALETVTKERDKARAAAPELLEALETLAERCTADHDDLERARAAIAKAKGDRPACTCGHPPHLGLCTKRSGGTAYACGCSRQTP